LNTCRTISLAASLVLAALPGRAESPPEPESYRTADYRAATPATLRGARVIATASAAAIWREDASVFIDVLPRPPKPANLPQGTVWREEPHESIPRATWLPNVGFGELAPVTEEYFRRGLASASAGNLDKPLVFFCLSDCWMSWNAAKRALGYGYRNVIWYPEGTDGWRQEGLPLVRVEPHP
jgi:PQQ-dependent catabolism-associated CXXCW motif protein